MTEVVEVRSRADLDAFIRLPGRLAAGDPHWIEPLRLERRRFLSPKRNPFFAHAEVRLWLALRDGRPAGRVSAQIDGRAAQAPGRRVGFFGMPAAADAEALGALLATAEAWLEGRGARLARGPFSLSVNHESGLLVDGFDSPPSMMTPHGPPWLGPAVERLGYVKGRDLFAYRLDLSEAPPRRLGRLAARTGTEGVRVRPLDMRRYGREIALVTDIFNDAWAGNWGFVPLSEAEVESLAADLKPILDPALVRIAEIDGAAVAFIVLLPNVNEAIAGLGGRLAPFGWARMLWRLRVAGLRTARVPLMGVRRATSATLLGKALPPTLIQALWPDALNRRIREVELSWILEDNRPMRRMAEALGARRAKTWRVYEKALA